MPSKHFRLIIRNTLEMLCASINMLEAIFLSIMPSKHISLALKNTFGMLCTPYAPTNTAEGDFF